VFYYLMIVVRMFMSPSDREIGPLANAPLARIAVIACAALTMLLFFFSKPVVDLFSSGYVAAAPAASAAVASGTNVVASSE
jgi:NADH:ubiquinone oxidoreductase subunit 2 (subunit N)